MVLNDLLQRVLLWHYLLGMMILNVELFPNGFRFLRALKSNFRRRVTVLLLSGELNRPDTWAVESSNLGRAGAGPRSNRLSPLSDEFLFFCSIFCFP
jgi:hypothetical protein